MLGDREYEQSQGEVIRQSIISGALPLAGRTVLTEPVVCCLLALRISLTVLQQIFSR